MSKKFKTVLVLLLTGLVSLSIYFIVNSEKEVIAANEGVYPISKHFKWRYHVINTSDESLKDVGFSALIPAGLTANQKLKILKASKNYSTSKDEVGNTYARFELSELAPHSRTIIDLKAQLDFALSAQDISGIEPEKYLSPSLGIESGHEELVQLAQQLKKSNAKESLKSYYNWIISNLNYSGYIKKDLGALYAYRNKRGDCTEYAYLMAALARASNIPARVIGGYVYAEDSLVKAEDYHNWVEVFYRGQWHIIDPQKERFMERTEEYLTVRVFPPEDVELQNSHQVIVSDERVRVTL